MKKTHSEKEQLLTKASHEVIHLDDSQSESPNRTHSKKSSRKHHEDEEDIDLQDEEPTEGIPIDLDSMKAKMLEPEYVVVFPRELTITSQILLTSRREKELAAKLRRKRKKVKKRMERVGLQVTLAESKADISNYYWLITASDDVLEAHAERRGLEKQLKTELGGGYAPYKRSTKDKFETYGGDIFRRIERIRLINSLVTRRRREGGANLSPRSLIAKEVIVSYFPLHEKFALQRLKNEWVKAFFRFQPIEDIRNYFGEKLALYFDWLGYYNQWCLYAAIVGLLVQIANFASGEGFDSWASLGYAIFISLWSTMFMEFWKREQSTKGHKWNMLSYEKREAVRPEFKGILRCGAYYNGRFINFEPIVKRNPQSPLKDRKALYFGPTDKLKKLFFVWNLILTMIVCVVIAALGLIVFKSFIEKQQGTTIGGIIGGTVNGLVIVILDWVYRQIAKKLTDWENHRTDTQYEDSLIFKNFLFQFVNSYIALFYVAFIKRNKWALFGEDKPEDCAYGSCMTELASLLGTLFFTRLAAVNTTEVLYPYIMSQLRSYYAQFSGKSELGEVVKQSQLEEYQGVLDQYNEIVIQFGYITLFAAAFPLAPLAAFISNLVEIRSDAFTFCLSTKRPHYEGARDIGTWESIIRFLGWLSVVTNVLLITVTSDQIVHNLPSNSTAPPISPISPIAPMAPKSSDNTDMYTLLIVAVVMENGILFLQWMIDMLIPDVPSKIVEDEARSHFLKEELLVRDGAADPEDWSDEDDINSSALL